MKKLQIILYGCLALLLVACQPQLSNHSFHIQGAINGVPEGTVVRLQVDRNQNLETLLETTVKEGHFDFTGVQDSTIECTVTYQLNGSTQGATFFLEAGDIQMDLSKETSSITGTPCNNRYQHFLNEINALYAKIGSVYNETPADSLDEHEQESVLKEKIAPLRNQVHTLVLNTVTDNIDNAVGYYLFRRFSQDLSAKDQERLINKMPVSYRRTTAIEEIRDQLAILPPDSLNTDTLYYEED